MVRLACALLALLLAIAGSRHVEAKRLVNPSIYADPQTCLNAMWAAADSILQSTDQIANCLRMCFHDAGTYQAGPDIGGVDGSVQFAQELAFPANAGLSICPGIMPTILQTVRNVPGCGQATFADVLQVSCAVGTFVLGGNPIPMVIGRPDATGPDLTANDRLPGPCNDLPGLIGFWSVTGISNPTLATIVLNGAHGIGAVRGNGPTCIPGGGAPSVIRTAGPAFDGSYYNRLLDPAIQGQFNSDIATVQPGAATLGTAQGFAADHASFLASWVGLFQEMSLLGCDASQATPMLPASFPVVRVNPSNPVSSPPPPPNAPVSSPPPPPNVPVSSPPPPPNMPVSSPPPPPNTPVFNPPVVTNPPVFTNPPIYNNPPVVILPPPAQIQAPPFYAPPVNPGTCVDGLPTYPWACPTWASQGSCGAYYQGQLVRKLCPKSCGACPSTPTSSPPPAIIYSSPPPPVSSPPTIVYSSPPPPVQPSGTCKDTFTNPSYACAYWAGQGSCGAYYKGQLVRSICAKTCGACKSPPPPAHGPACGKKGKNTLYCAVSQKCCSNKTCCPANRVCCGSSCCGAGKKCCTYKSWYAPYKYRTTYACKSKC